MPSTSQKQRRALYAKFGEKWVKAHHFDKVVSRSTKRKAKAKVRRKAKRR